MIPPLAAIFAWPVFSFVFFQNLRVPFAILATILGGFLLLPEHTALDFPMLPPIDKATVPALLCLIFVGFTEKSTVRFKGLLPQSWLVRICLLLLVFGALLTVLTNPNALTFGDIYLPGLRPYDGFSYILAAIMLLLPLIVGRRFLATPENHKMMVFAFCIAGLCYSLPTLIEVRLSPQLNNTVYGFFAHDWRQHMRGNGGFRPIVFLGHGLILSIFLAFCTLAAAGLSRVDTQNRTRWLFATAWLFVVLFLSKSLGALLICCVLLPVILLASERTQLLAAGLLAALVLSYPAVRQSNLLPIDSILDTIATYRPDRAGSLETRLTNEKMMLDRVSERMAFGWGGNGRWRVFDSTGRDLTIADGYWIITLGIGGWTRYIGTFGLLTLPIILLAIRARRQKIGMETAILAIILSSNLIDMIPNSSSLPLTWLLAGALWGRLELEPDFTDDTLEKASSNSNGQPSSRYRIERKNKEADAAAPETRESPYTRQKTRKTRG